jgi:hypothetical protein
LENEDMRHRMSEENKKLSMKYTWDNIVQNSGLLEAMVQE